MVGLDQLEALDLLLWLASSHRAAALAFTNQSTIIRRSNAVLQEFGVSIRRETEGWTNQGDTGLLAMERAVHQQARLLGRRPLRLQVPFWTQRGALRGLPQGWTSNPCSPEHVCENPVALLRERVIDACLVTPTQMPIQADDLVALDLYRSPIELTIFHEGDLADPRSRYLRLRERGGCRLRLFEFLPRTCKVISYSWFDALQGSAPCGPATAANHGADDLAVSFLTPQMRAAQNRPFLVDDDAPARDYVERLVVLAQNAHHPAVLQLQEHLLGLFGGPAAPQPVSEPRLITA